MYSTDVYYFIPRQDVVLNVGNSPRRYQTVYAKNLKLHKGVDNRLQFRFLNQEQKPIDISNKEITCRIISNDGHTVLLEKALIVDPTASSMTLPVTGIAEFRVTSGELSNIDSQFGYYTLQIPSDSFGVPVFVDSDAGGRGKIHIVDSILPDFEPSTQLLMRPRTGSDTFYYSDVFYTKDSAFTTFQLYLNGFTGTVDIEGLDDTGMAVAIDSVTYDNAVGSQSPINVTGYFYGIRFKFNSIVDPTSSDKILAR